MLRLTTTNLGKGLPARHRMHQKPTKHLQNAGQHQKYKVQAARDSQTSTLKQNAKHSSTIFSHSHQPEWLDNVHGQRMGYDKLHKRLYNMVRTGPPIVTSVNHPRSLKRIAKILPAGRDSVKNMHPQPAAWYGWVTI